MELKRYTGREVLATRPDVKIKIRKEKPCIMIDVAISAERNVRQSEAEWKIKYSSLYTETHQTWNMKCMGPRNSNKRFKETIGSHTRKTFSTFTTTDSYTWNITLNTESAVV